MVRKFIVRRNSSSRRKERDGVRKWVSQFDWLYRCETKRADIAAVTSPLTYCPLCTRDLRRLSPFSLWTSSLSVVFNPVCSGLESALFSRSLPSSPHSPGSRRVCRLPHLRIIFLYVSLKLFLMQSLNNTSLRSSLVTRHC